MKTTPKQYAQLIFDSVQGLSEKEATLVLGRIAKVIQKNKDQKKINRIGQIFEKLEKEEKGRVTAVVQSARELNQESRLEIQTQIAQRFKTEPEKVEVENIVDPELIGGVKIRIENEILDASLRGKLEKLRAQV